MFSKIYAFSMLCSLSASVPPLEELVQLWDIIFAFGIHMNILFCLSNVLANKEEIMNTSNKGNTNLLLRQESLNAEFLISSSMQLVKSIPNDLYDKLTRHPYCSTKSVLVYIIYIF